VTDAQERSETPQQIKKPADDFLVRPVFYG
jgi:hypothetical protein